MKPWPILLPAALLLGGAAGASAQTAPGPAPAATAQPAADTPPVTALSEETTVKLRAILPKYDAEAAEAARERAARKRERPKPAEGVLVLPDYKVKEKKVEQPTSQDMMSRVERDKEAIRQAEAKMNALDLALNRWHLPFLSASFQDRAREEYEAKRRAEEAARLDALSKLPRVDGGKP